jgi:hypothetical protein
MIAPTSGFGEAWADVGVLMGPGGVGPGRLEERDRSWRGRGSDSGRAPGPRRRRGRLGGGTCQESFLRHRGGVACPLEGWMDPAPADQSRAGDGGVHRPWRDRRPSFELQAGPISRSARHRALGAGPLASVRAVRS